MSNLHRFIFLRITSRPISAQQQRVSQSERSNNPSTKY